nr:alpha/beta hydrolase [Microbispora triticiradicis]
MAEIPVEVGEQRRDERHERLAVLVRAEPGRVLRGHDPSRVAVAGHSEGALIAANLAAAFEPPREPGSGSGAGLGDGTAARPVVAAVVLLSPSAKPGAETLRWQAERLAPSMPAAVRWLLRLTRTDLVTKVLKNHERIRRTTTDVARIGGVLINARWTREFLDHDPAADLSGIHAPVLAVTGEKDLQVDPADLARVAESVPGPVETHVIPDLDHILRRQPGPPSLRAYRREAREPVDAQVKAIVTGWLTERLAPDARS